MLMYGRNQHNMIKQSSSNEIFLSSEILITLYNIDEPWKQ